jgi:hypothetical protein
MTPPDAIDAAVTTREWQRVAALLLVPESIDDDDDPRTMSTNSGQI